MRQAPAKDHPASRPGLHRRGRRRRPVPFLALLLLIAVVIAAWTPALRTWLLESSWWRQVGRITAMAVAFGCFGIVAWGRPLPMVAVSSAPVLLLSWGSQAFVPGAILAVVALAAVVFWATRAWHEALPPRFRERRGRLALVHAEIKKARLGLKRLQERAHMLEPEVVEREVATHLEERKTAEALARLRREPTIWPSPDTLGPDADRLRFLISHFPESLSLAYSKYLDVQTHPVTLPAYVWAHEAPEPAGGREPGAREQADGLRRAWNAFISAVLPESRHTASGSPSAAALSDPELKDRAESLRLLEPIAEQWRRRVEEVRKELEAKFDADHAVEQGMRSQWSAGRDVIAAAQEKEARHTRELKLEEDELLAAEKEDTAPSKVELAFKWLVARRRLDPRSRRGEQPAN